MYWAPTALETSKFSFGRPKEMEFEHIDRGDERLREYFLIFNKNKKKVIRFTIFCLYYYVRVVV